MGEEFWLGSARIANNCGAMYRARGSVSSGSPEQRETYRLAEEEGVLRLTELGDSATIQHVFELVLRLKQICNFDPATGESAKLERLAGRSGRSRRQRPQGDRLQPMGRHARNGCSERLARFGPLEYHGRMPSPQRDDVIARFRDDPQRHVLLISYGAGGVGLNLQFAGYVFLFDRWWNPAVEDQAINRAHRIGAAGPVTVTPFLTLSRSKSGSIRCCARSASCSTRSSPTPPAAPAGPEPERDLRPLPAPRPAGPIDVAA